jgi:hypothetical protein
MKLSIKDIPAKLIELLSKLNRYAVVLFLLLVALVYGFLVLRIQSMQNVQPSNNPTPGTVVATPHIDQKVVDQLQQLQDNSVSVKSLFDQARSNPFQE